jgi:hypothetical protein
MVSKTNLCNSLRPYVNNKMEESMIFDPLYTRNFQAYGYSEVTVPPCQQ